jgi:hypothetical protein
LRGLIQTTKVFARPNAYWQYFGSFFVFTPSKKLTFLALKGVSPRKHTLFIWPKIVHCFGRRDIVYLAIFRSLLDHCLFGKKSFTDETHYLAENVSQMVLTRVNTII